MQVFAKGLLLEAPGHAVDVEARCGAGMIEEHHGAVSALVHAFARGDEEVHVGSGGPRRRVFAEASPELVLVAAAGEANVFVVLGDRVHRAHRPRLVEEDGRAEGGAPRVGARRCAGVGDAGDGGGAGRAITGGVTDQRRDGRSVRPVDRA